MHAPASRQTPGKKKAAMMPKRPMRYPASVGAGTTRMWVPNDTSPKDDA